MAGAHSILDFPAHALFLAANHRFLLIAVPFGAIFLLPRKLSALTWLLVMLNVFFGTYISSYALYNVGVTGPAQITSTYDTSTVYNNRYVIGYKVQIKTADGTIVETSFEDEDFNQYPGSNTFVTPRPGDKFNVRYLPTFPQDFVIITNDDSPWAQRLACRPLEQRVFEAERKYEFGDRSLTYRDPFIQAIEIAIAAGCYDGNSETLQAYRNKIGEVKAGRQ
jgi:hypothetical protein